MQTVLVFVIIALALFFTGRRFYRGLKKGGPTGCGCGCSGCDIKASCEGPTATPPKTPPEAR